MAFPTPATSHLEIRMSNKGKLEAFWKGDRLTTFEIDISHCKGERADVRLRFVGPQVKLSTQPDVE